MGVVLCWFRLFLAVLKRLCCHFFVFLRAAAQHFSQRTMQQADTACWVLVPAAPRGTVGGKGGGGGGLGDGSVMC